MSNICIILIIGIPGAGKTTFVKKLRKVLPTFGTYKLHTIIYDDMFENDCYKDYKSNRRLAFEATKKLIQEIQQEKDDYLVVVDDNMYLKSMRYEYYKLARDCEIAFFQIHFDVPLATALERNARRVAPVPEHVIKQMANKFESPCENWEKYTLIIDLKGAEDNSVLSKLFNILENCMNNPVVNIISIHEEKPSTSVLQQIDVILRKIVHKNIKQNVSKASVVCNRRIEIFKHIKDGTINVDTNLNHSELEILLQSLF